MLIAGALDFVVFLRKRNDFASGGVHGSRRRERPRGRRPRRAGAVQRGLRTGSTRAAPRPHAPIACIAGARGARLPAARARAVGLMLDRSRVRAASFLTAGRRQPAAASSVLIAVRCMGPTRPSPRRRRSVVQPAGTSTAARPALVVAAVLVLVLTVLIVTRLDRAGDRARRCSCCLWKRMFGGGRRRATRHRRGSRAWPPGRSPCATPSPGRSAWSRRSPRRRSTPRRRSGRRSTCFVDRLRVREPLPDALMKFADDLDDPSADLIVAALILNSRLRGPGLRDVLSALADSGRDELDVRRRVEGSRRSTRRSVQIVVGGHRPDVGALVLFNRSYVQPYASVERPDRPCGRPGDLRGSASSGSAACPASRPRRFLTGAEDARSLTRANAGDEPLMALSMLTGAVSGGRPPPGVDSSPAGPGHQRDACPPRHRSAGTPRDDVHCCRRLGRRTARCAARGIGQRLEVELAVRGWEFSRTRSDLEVLNQSMTTHLGTKVLLALAALVWFPMVLSIAAVREHRRPRHPHRSWPRSPPSCCPTFSCTGRQTPSRRDFRHVMGSFLDLVAMNLAGGRGLPEALMAASSIGDHWAMVRIRQALSNARIVGVTPWEGIAQLGRDLGVDELRDLASALALAGDEGAKIRASLLARSESMRRKELVDVEGLRGKIHRSMLMAQLLMCVAFLIFMAYPAIRPAGMRTHHAPSGKE
ncbi:MAG: type II secretion system F family protein [Nocardioidaceae bacterium]